MSQKLKGVIIDLDYVMQNGNAVVRIAFKSEGKIHAIFDKDFLPYFYVNPYNPDIDEKELLLLSVQQEGEAPERAKKIERERKILGSKEEEVLKVYISNPKSVPRFSRLFSEFGECFEHDIVFWKRYLIDKNISPLSQMEIEAREEENRLIVESIKNVEAGNSESLKHISFDIETYNPAGMPNASSGKDPIIMISYTDGKERAVLTYKEISEDFVKTYGSEEEMIRAFIEVIRRIDPDIIVGYNSSNFDLPYLKARAERLKINFNDICRFDGEARQEHHGMIEAFRIPGRINLDVFNVAKFVSVVGAAEQLIKVSSFKLYDVYSAVTGKKKINVDKMAIWERWDKGGKDIEELARYSMSDAVSLDELYDFFLPLEIEMARVSGTTISEASISTTGQLVEYGMMRNAAVKKHMIPNKPEERVIGARVENPFEGAFVKTPEAGIYDNIVVFDFKGLYPSIIIAHNIDNSTLCRDCDDAFVSPTGFRFRKAPRGIMPMVLKELIDERNQIKKAHKSNPEDKELTARYQALKILANSFYGYLGYARSRWYSRECASSVTAYGRSFVTKLIEDAENAGFKVLYSDTDSSFILLGEKTKQEAMSFLEGVNRNLPQDMELELEDFYTRGVFVGKKGENGTGAKKKYALLSQSGKIKIRGFELVRRDWSRIARDTQRAVLETILHEGDKEKAANIVKEVIKRLREGSVDLRDLTIQTQIRKSLRSYDIKSPEIAAAKKAVAAGIKKREELEGATISYVITKSGNSISDKAEIEDLAKDYDADYYIQHQILPATMKLLKELGYEEGELKDMGKQKKL